MNAEAKQITVPEAIEAAKERFLQIAPHGLDFTAEHGFAVQLLNNNDYLKSVALTNPRSLESAIINVAAIGLSLNPAKKQAYLIPRNVKHGDKWVSKIFLEPSYVGLCDLATQSGSIKWVQAQLVRAADTFVDHGPGQKPTHTYEAFAPAEKRGEIVGVYCTAKTDGGDYLNEIMTREDIIAIRDRSEAWKRKVEKEKKGGSAHGGPWESDFAEMAKKSVIRRAFKTWPKTETLDRLAAAIDLSNNNEGFEPILTSPGLGQYTADQKAYFDQMISGADAIGMFLFTRSIEEATYTNLFHSFEKGQKGKYQGIVRTLVEEGGAKLRELQEAVQASASEGDTYAIAENLGGLQPEAIEYIKEQCSPSEITTIEQALKQDKAA